MDTSERRAPSGGAGRARDKSRPRGWRLITVLGIPIHVRWSALAMVVLLWVILYQQLSAGGGLGATAMVLAATVTTLGFLASVIVHELAHAVTARRLGIVVEGVSVFYLGGVTRMSSEPDTPEDDFTVAVVGPLINLVLAGALLLVGRALGTDALPGAIMAFLGRLNAVIGVFNLLPGDPLDGGALLRAVAWRVSGDRLRAARLAGRAGMALAYTVLGLGVFGLVSGWLGGVRGGGSGDGGVAGLGTAWVWVILVGLFMLSTARGGLMRTRVRQRLEGLRVTDLTRPTAWHGESHWTVARITADLIRSQSDGLVTESETVVGTFGPAELEDIPSSRWEQLTLGEVMSEVLGSVDEDDTLLDTLARFEGTSESVLAVTRSGIPVGILHGRDVLAHLRHPTP